MQQMKKKNCRDIKTPCMHFARIIRLLFPLFNQSSFLIPSIALLSALEAILHTQLSPPGAIRDVESGRYVSFLEGVMAKAFKALCALANSAGVDTEG